MKPSEKLLRQLIKEHGRQKTRQILNEMQSLMNTPFSNSILQEVPTPPIIKAL